VEDVWKTDQFGFWQERRTQRGKRKACKRQAVAREKGFEGVRVANRSSLYRTAQKECMGKMNHRFQKEMQRIPGKKKKAAYQAGVQDGRERNDN